MMSKLQLVVVLSVAFLCSAVGQPLEVTAPVRFPQNFPATIDGTVIFIKPVPEVVANLGVIQFDAICGTVFNAKPIVCDGNTGRSYFDAFDYGYTNKPVYAYNAYQNYPNGAGAYVQIARSPADLLASGFATAGAGVSNSFYFFTDENPPMNFIPGAAWPSPLQYITMGASVGDQAWNGCKQDGTANLGINTCQGWTTNSATVSGAIGNSFLLTPQTQNSWLYSGASFDCSQKNKWVYCAWSPSASDGIKNGDETNIDCGGSTLKIDGTSQPTCPPCNPGYTGPDGGPCTACPLNFYKSIFGSSACLPCATRARTVTTASPRCFCKQGYSVPFNVVPAVDGSNCQTAHVVGDPQITGLQGQDFQVHGMPDEIFNMISSPDFQVNTRFIFLNKASCPDNRTACFTHPGTYISEVGLLVNGERVKVVAGPAAQGLRVWYEDREIIPGEKLAFTNSNATLEVVDKREVRLLTNLFSYAAVNSDQFVNQEVALLDDDLMERGSKLWKYTEGAYLPYEDAPIHGLLGQTWKNIEYPGRQYIEGNVMDYHVQEDDLFATEYMHSLYTAQ